LGREFFRQVPEAAGVYLMRDASDTVLYVGKAKNLRKRLNAYRVANPDRMARRHLRMLRSVSRIEVQICSDESAALARESELLLALRPRFNRTGTWRGPTRFLQWRQQGEEEIQVGISDTAQADWRHFGPLGSRAFLLRGVLLRLLWFGAHPERGFQGMPAGWVRGRFDNPTAIRTGFQTGRVHTALEELFAGEVNRICDWVRCMASEPLHAFQKAALEADLEELVRVSHFHSGSG
jgi:predicted GIY-YIG superfamily endonuclease